MPSAVITRHRSALPIALAFAALSCTTRCDSEGRTAAGDLNADAKAPWAVETKSPSIPKGMVWIPAGALVAGTPVDLLPRIVDEEMHGEQVILQEFFIDRFSYPNEEGAIPLTNVTRDQAAALCEEQGKRLCSELEWERACKGPDNYVYEYGNRYRAEACGTGTQEKLLPSGLHHACTSAFGVRDLHGGIWEWTDSPWGRGSKGELVAQRGGNGPAGQVIGRCANGRARKPDHSSGTTGFRCCRGARNDQEVTLEVVRGPKLRRYARLDAERVVELEALIPDDVLARVQVYGKFHTARMWDWHPVGNEHFIVIGGCAGSMGRQKCGVLVARPGVARTDALVWVDSGWYLPMVRVDRNPRDLWVYGGDAKTHFRRRVTYRWGAVYRDEVERNTQDSKKKKSKKGTRTTRTKGKSKRRRSTLKR